MARAIHMRWKLTGTLVACSPLHVGGMGGDADVDLTLAVDGQGRWYIPGTSLAGALREHTRARAGTKRCDRLWGYQTNGDGHASHVVIEDAGVQLPAGGFIEVREGVGIDRVTGAAAREIKYDRAVLPQGSRVALSLTVEVPAEKDEAGFGALLGDLCKALEDRGVALGAARTRGLGHVKLEGARLVRRDLRTKQGTLAALRGKDPELRMDSLAAPEGLVPIPELQLLIHWVPLGPVMVKAEQSGIAVDALPLTTAHDGKLAFVVPGSALKGLLRSHAERIVRTVTGTGAPVIAQDGRDRFLSQLRLPLVDEIFGAVRGAFTEEGDDVSRPTEEGDAAPRLGRGALSVDDCLSNEEVERERWTAVTRAETSGALNAALSNAGLPKAQQAFHVAVDRWTGGAAENLLFTVLEPWGITWKPIEIRVDLRRIPSELRLAAVTLLLLVVRDMAREQVSIGFASTRGMGAMKVESVDVKGTGLDANMASLVGLKLVNGAMAGIPEVVRNSLNEAWKGWFTSMRGEL